MQVNLRSRSGALPPPGSRTPHLAEDDLVAVHRLESPCRVAIATVGGQQEEPRIGRAVDPHDIVRRNPDAAKRLAGQGEESSTALANSAPWLSTAWADCPPRGP